MEQKCYEDYRNVVLTIARFKAPEYSKFDLGSVRDSWIDKLSVEEAADTVVMETAYFAGDFP